MGALVELIALIKEIPEEHLEEAIEKIKEIKEKADLERDDKTCCPHCGSQKIVRNGHKSRKQAYLCRVCGKSFVSTTKSAIQNSHSSATVWKQVISDTIDGISIDKTAQSLDLHHETVFNMRHKILYAIERSLNETPIKLIGVCETDETYVLEGNKGRKIPEDYHRKSRKHGAVAAKRGISDEYICMCTSVTGNGEKVAIAINRATPSSKEVFDVFGERVCEDTVVLCDGNQSYNILDEKCTVAIAKRINKVNGFHSFIKEKLATARGVSTVYLNRYSALFSKCYASDKSIVDDVFEIMTSEPDYFNTILHTQSVNLLIV